MGSTEKLLNTCIANKVSAGKQKRAESKETKTTVTRLGYPNVYTRFSFQ